MNEKQNRNECDNVPGVCFPCISFLSLIFSVDRNKWLLCMNVSEYMAWLTHICFFSTVNKHLKLEHVTYNGNENKICLLICLSSAIHKWTNAAKLIHFDWMFELQAKIFGKILFQTRFAYHLQWIRINNHLNEIFIDVYSVSIVTSITITCISLMWFMCATHMNDNYICLTSINLLHFCC